MATWVAETCSSSECVWTYFSVPVCTCWCYYSTYFRLMHAKYIK